MCFWYGRELTWSRRGGESWLRASINVLSFGNTSLYFAIRQWMLPRFRVSGAPRVVTELAGSSLPWQPPPLSQLATPSTACESILTLNSSGAATCIWISFADRRNYRRTSLTLLASKSRGSLRLSKTLGAWLGHHGELQCLPVWTAARALSQLLCRCRMVVEKQGP